MNQTSMTKMTSSTKEVWKDIPGYEGLYQVSDQGRVRSLDRCVEVNDPKRKTIQKMLQRSVTKTWDG